MTTTVELNSFRTTRLYTIGEAARFAKVTPETVRRWLFGTVDQAPVLNYGPDREKYVVSFLELVELVIARRFRRRNVRIERIREGHDYARTELGIPYPFAWQNLAVQGGRILREFQEKNPGSPLVELNEGQQATLPGMVLVEFEALEWADDEFAERWFPCGKQVPIVIDPQVGAGAPTVVGRRLTVQSIYKRRKAGYSMTRIAKDTGMRVDDVDQILLYANDVRMAA